MPQCSSHRGALVRSQPTLPVLEIVSSIMNWKALIYAIRPHNFTALGNNLATLPALLGNVRGPLKAIRLCHCPQQPRIEHCA